MDFPTWLDAERGRLTAVARRFGKSQSAVSQWRTNGVPPRLMRAVHELTRGDVTLEEMLPDPAWPHPQGRPLLDVAAAVKESSDAA